jgi:hypothetical protein
MLSSGRSLAELFARRAFTIGTREYLWLDVVLAAMLRGDWAPFEAALREGLACASYAEATGEDAGEAADDLLNEFRYARDLITAAEAEAWLQGVGLTGAELSAYFERRVLLARWRPDLPAIMAAHPVSAGDLADALASEGICSGAFERFALALAGRAAVFERVVTDGDAGVGPVARPVPGAAALPALLAEHAEVLQGHPAADCLPRLPHLAAIDAAFELMAAREITESAMRARITTSRLDWMRVSIERLAFSQESMAREAVLCCRQDGLTLGELAADINRRLDREDVLLETCDPDVQAAVLSAPPGQIIGPLQIGDMHHVLVVRSKQVPVLEDPEVRARAERALRESLLERERTARVRWGGRY